MKCGAKLWFTGDLAKILRFDQDCASSPYTPDINGGFSSLDVHTDIVDPQFVGMSKYLC